MKTTYYKSKPHFKDVPSTFYVKVTDGKSIEVSDDNIYINDGTYEELCAEYLCKFPLEYIEATREEFDNAYIKVTRDLNEIINL